MKKIVLSFLWIVGLSSAPIGAQSTLREYRPFAKEGKVWKMQMGWIEENEYCNYIDGDTLINNEIWKKVYNYVGFPDFSSTYYAAVRDVGKKVYAIAKGCKMPRLLYDFDLREGDYAMCGVEGNAFGCLLENVEQPDTLLGFPFVSFLRLEHIDTVSARGLEHRRFTFSLLDAFRDAYMNGDAVPLNNVIWIEGVGSGAGPFLPWMPLPPRDTYFQSCDINKTCIFGYPDFYEAGLSNCISHKHQENGSEKMLYDFSGRCFTSTITKGLFICGRKKVLVK